MSTHRGSLISSRWIRGVFWDRVDVYPDRVELQPWLRRCVTLKRSEVVAIEFESMFLPPIWWTTNVVFRNQDQVRVGKIFNPLRTSVFRDDLERSGWRVVESRWSPTRTRSSRA